MALPCRSPVSPSSSASAGKTIKHPRQNSAPHRLPDFLGLFTPSLEGRHFLAPGDLSEGPFTLDRFFPASVSGSLLAGGDSTSAPRLATVARVSLSLGCRIIFHRPLSYEQTRHIDFGARWVRMLNTFSGEYLL